jgi:Domain of unknown function (DUF4277)
MNAQIRIQQPMQKASEMKVENLDHLGLVAGLIDEIGIVQKINELVGEQPGEIVSPGLLDLICSGDGDVPLFLRAASGNESDNSVFASIFQDFKKQLNLDSLMVADSALYTAPNLEMLTNLRWLTRVPLSLKQAQQLVSQLNESEFQDSSVTGYSWSEHKSNYGGITQRWLVVESNLRRDSDQGYYVKTYSSQIRP